MERLGFLVVLFLVDLVGRFLAATARGFTRCFDSFVALRAGAFPADERFVAGFKRVDFFPAKPRFRDGDTDE